MRTLPRTLVAVLFNLIFLPLGYFFLKQRVRFWAFLALALLLAPVLSLAHYLAFWTAGPRFALFFVVTSALVWHLFLIFDTIRAARLPADPSPIFSLTGAGLWVLPLIMIGMLGISFLTAPLRSRIISTHAIGASSMMLPAIKPGEYATATGLFSTRDLRRGDLVLVQVANHPALYLLRVYGLPGERITAITVADGGSSVPFFRTRMSIDERPVAQICADPAPAHLETTGMAALLESSPPRICKETMGDFKLAVRETLIPAPGEKRFADVTLGPDEYYLLGDNRDSAYDSRHFGPIGARRIRGRYLYTFLSLAYTAGTDAKTEDGDCDTVPFRFQCFLKNPGGYTVRLARTGAIAP